MKLVITVFIIVMVMICLNLAGVPTASGSVLNYKDLIAHPENFNDMPLGSKVFIILGVVSSVAAVTVSFLKGGSIENFLVVPLAVLMAGFIGDWLSVLTYIKSIGSADWINYIITPLFLSVAVMYMISIIDWFRGVD